MSLSLYPECFARPSFDFEIPERFKAMENEGQLVLSTRQRDLEGIQNQDENCVEPSLCVASIFSRLSPYILILLDLSDPSTDHQGWLHDPLTNPKFGQVWNEVMLAFKNTCFDI